MALTPLTIRLTAATRQALQEECDRNGVRLSEYVRDTLVARIVYERASRGEATHHEAISVLAKLEPERFLKHENPPSEDEG